MTVRVLEFRRHGAGGRAGGTLFIEIGDERITSEVSLVPLDEFLRVWEIDSDRLKVLIATHDVWRQLQRDLHAAFEGSPRPLPWDYD